MGRCGGNTHVAGREAGDTASEAHETTCDASGQTRGCMPTEVRACVVGVGTGTGPGVHVPVPVPRRATPVPSTKNQVKPLPNKTCPNFVCLRRAQQQGLRGFLRGSPHLLRSAFGWPRPRGSSPRLEPFRPWRWSRITSRAPLSTAASRAAGMPAPSPACALWIFGLSSALPTNEKKVPSCIKVDHRM